jgi:hypothetical protein
LPAPSLYISMVRGVAGQYGAGQPSLCATETERALACTPTRRVNVRDSADARTPCRHWGALGRSTQHLPSVRRADRSDAMWRAIPGLLTPIDREPADPCKRERTLAISVSSRPRQGLRRVYSTQCRFRVGRVHAGGQRRVHAALNRFVLLALRTPTSRLQRSRKTCA